MGIIISFALIIALTRFYGWYSNEEFYSQKVQKLKTNKY